MRLKAILLLISGIILTTAIAATVQNKGAENIEIYGGKTGKVSFPHLQHQETLGDCNICHDIFPQESGSIKSLKAQGKLKKKHVMNKHCIKCHRAKKSSGEKAGPTRCKECHKK